MWIFIKITAKPYSFLVVDATLALLLVIDATLLVINATPLRFRNNLVERILKLIMGIDEKIRDEKLQYDIEREAAKKMGIIIQKNW